MLHLTNESRVDDLYYFIEFCRQFSQKLFGLWFFNLPGLIYLRNTVYRIAFATGRNLIIGEGVYISRSHHATEGNISIGKDVSIARNTKIDYTGQVIIEDGASISEGTYILSHQHSMYSPIKEVIPTKTMIKEGAWIGAHVKIVPSSTKEVLTIGRHSVISVGSVITKNVPDYAIIAGNPYKYSSGLIWNDPDRSI